MINEYDDIEDVKVYLAGPVKEAEDSGVGWRETIAEKTSLTTLNPLDKYNSETDPEDWSSRRIVLEDLEMISQSDGVLVAYDGEPTWGTPMEIRYAHNSGIPVALAWTCDRQVSPWASQHVTLIRSDIERCAKVLEKFFQGQSMPFSDPSTELYSAKEGVEKVQLEMGVET